MRVDARRARMLRTTGLTAYPCAGWQSKTRSWPSSTTRWRRRGGCSNGCLKRTRLEAHDKSMTLGQLAGHIANIPYWCSAILAAPVFDLAAAGPDARPAAPEKSRPCCRVRCKGRQGTDARSRSHRIPRCSRHGRSRRPSRDLHDAAGSRAQVVRDEPHHPSSRTVERVPAAARTCRCRPSTGRPQTNNRWSSATRAAPRPAQPRRGPCLVPDSLHHPVDAQFRRAIDTVRLDLAFYMPAALERIESVRFFRATRRSSRRRRRLTGFDEVIAGLGADHACAAARDCLRCSTCSRWRSWRPHSGCSARACIEAPGRPRRCRGAHAAARHSRIGHEHTRGIFPSASARLLARRARARRLPAPEPSRHRRAAARGGLLHPTTALWFAIWIGVAHRTSKTATLAAARRRRGAGGNRWRAGRSSPGRSPGGCRRWIPSGSRRSRRRTTSSRSRGRWTSGSSTLAYAPLIVWLYKRRLAAGAVVGGERGLGGWMPVAAGDLRRRAAVQRMRGSRSPCNFRRRGSSGCSTSLPRSTRCGGSRKEWRVHAHRARLDRGG